jgi:hypothetical protein
MRIRTILKAAAVPGVLAAALLGSSAAAFASTGPVSNGQAGHLTGNAATSYSDPVFGNVTCNEVQHPAFDNVTCKFTGNNPTFQVDGKVDGQIGWNSDFGTSALQPQPGTQQFPSHTNPGTLTYTFTGPAGGQATGYTGQVTYSS